MRSYTPLWSEKWEKRIAEEAANGRATYHEGLAAQEALDSLERRFQALAALVPAHAAETESVKSLLEGAKDDIRLQKRGNEGLLGRIPAQWRTPRTPRLTEKVFGMPELLEHILTFVSVPDLLRLYRVNRTFFNTIEGSTTLQRRLGLQPNQSCRLDLPAEHLVHHDEGVDMNSVFYGAYFADEEQFELNTMPIKINVCTYGPYAKSSEMLQLRPLGERCKKMLITQPPIKEMGVYMQCCTTGYRPYRDHQTDAPVEVLKCDTGIKLEQIWDTVLKVQNEHRLCPNAEAFDHDCEGFVQLRMTIEGSLVLSEDDPTLIAKNKRRQEGREENLEVRGREAKFRPYIVAKRAARDNGEPIPTFADFLAKQDEPLV